MNGHENLIPFSERSKEEARKLGRKGGIASGEARRRKKTFKEELLFLLDQNDNRENISIAMIKEALAGNTKAFETIRDTVGEKPVDKVADVTGEIDITIK